MHLLPYPLLQVPRCALNTRVGIRKEKVCRPFRESNLSSSIVKLVGSHLIGRPNRLGPSLMSEQYGEILYYWFRLRCLRVRTKCGS